MSRRRAEQTSIGGWLGQVAAWFVISAVVLLLAVSVVVPRLAGATPYTILTGSMRPGMPPGTLVVVRPVAAGDIGVGDVVTYQLRSGEPTVVTHRVVGVAVTLDGQQSFRTQGDANPTSDERAVRPVQVRGERWYSVPYLGYVTNAFSTAQRQVAMTVVVIGLLTYAALMLAGSARDRRRIAVRARSARPSRTTRHDPTGAAR